MHGSERNMKQQFDTSLFIKLAASLEGEFFYDDTMRTLYATDASVYKEYPLAVCYPKTKKDIQSLIQFAHQHKTSLIPRTAGTSLGGQVVGGGKRFGGPGGKPGSISGGRPFGKRPYGGGAGKSFGGSPSGPRTEE